MRWIGTVGIAALVVTGVAADDGDRRTAMGEQTTPATGARATGADEQKTDADEKIVTMSGCLYRERDVPGRTPNVAERTGVLEDYILAAAKPADASGSASGTAGTSGSAASGTASGSMYKVENIDDERLEKLVGKRVEVTGRIDREAGDRGPGATGTAGTPTDESIGPDRIELPEFEATSIREASGPACPSTPQQ